MQQVKEWTDNISDWNAIGEDFYISAQIKAESVNPSKVFVIGDEKKYGDYVNKKLLGGEKYKIYSRGLASKIKVYMEDNAWLHEDMKFIFECSTRRRHRD